MRKSFAVCLLFCAFFSQGQVGLNAYSSEIYKGTAGEVYFARLNPGVHITESQVENFLNANVLAEGNGAAVRLKSSDRDGLGYTHLRFEILLGNIPVAGKSIVAHIKNGALEMLNGDLSGVTLPVNSQVITEDAALQSALNKVAAEKYKWQNKAEESHMREVLGDPDFTYYPNGTKMIYSKGGKNYYAWRFNIYAEVPLYRSNVFVDASSGKILAEENLICTADVPGTAVTKYSGTQTIVCNQVGAIYQLKETGRGQGVETYNLNNTANYVGAPNFTSSSVNWTGTGIDQGSRDAHWGAEKTYDYYLSQHNRNSINGSGFKLISYVHYNTNYSNAFWDGQRMTYGDGNGNSMRIFTALDVCGHEITHGLTGNTAGLNYSNESGALNESFSDIFGAAVENYARPSNWNWKVGEDITASNAGLRNMSSPNNYGDPDTYMDTNWYTGSADNGGVHTNSGVGNYWFYLLVTGGSGVNDISNAYSVNGLGMTSAAKIAFRALTVYYTSTTNYANARQLSIQAAKDLFGDCSNEMLQTANAWYAVGVGPQISLATPGPNFSASSTSYCAVPATVSFINTTANGQSYFWDFGDGSTATSTNAVHSYTASGSYSVKLKATGCNVTDSVTKLSFININVPAIPAVSGAVACGNNSVQLNAAGTGNLLWYSSPSSTVLLNTGTSYITPNLPALEPVILTQPPML